MSIKGNYLLKGRRSARGQTGFTLAELVVISAITIIALPAALVGPKLFPELGKAKQSSAAKAQIELIGQALDQFRLDLGSYPTTQEGFNTLM